MIFASRKKIQVKISTFFQPMKERKKKNEDIIYVGGEWSCCLYGRSYIITNKKFSTYFNFGFDVNGFNLKLYFLYFLGMSVSSIPAKKRAHSPNKMNSSKYNGKIFFAWCLISTRIKINSLNFTAGHLRQSSAFLLKLRDVLLKIKMKKYAYITLLVEALLRKQSVLTIQWCKEWSKLIQYRAI